ncbi:prolyl aminopeptidase [Saccharopolyspora gloriosae]|uniref:prolyl aminopeptidase n=1 Tax=Saccharopolyspora gloriosae TaxID=455344 RepID=UPI001FB6E697|nr:prolyl aminopeptidase [Saccharopolyspora gloriosae]
MYPEIEPHASGRLDVGGGHLVHWESCGNPDGKPVVVLHGGPGSGCTPGWRRYFDPDAYRIVLFDQRGCGRSTPLADEPDADLATNTTHHLIADVELLRRHLGVERWMVFGGSWGSTLGLAYAESNPERVTELVLFSVVTTTHREVEWITQDMRRVFPEQWDRFRAGVPEDERDGRLVDVYSRLLHDPDPVVRARAARDWCRWEEAHVEVGHARRDPRYDDPDFRLRFARLVTHYWRHGAWFEDGELLRNAEKLAGIPGALVHGRKDVSGPPDIAWQLAQAWPDAELLFIDDAGHGGGGGVAEALIEVTDRFATR